MKPDEPTEERDLSADVARTPGRWDTLAQAFQAHHFPSENLPLVQQLVDHVGVSHYEDIESRGYIKAIRRDRGKALHIHFGYTGGLASESEIFDSVGDVDRGSWFDGREWWIAHPVNKLRDGTGTGSRSAEREADFCPSCFMQLPASGICDTCAA